MPNISQLFRQSYAESLDKTFLKLPDSSSYSFRDIDSLACSYAGVLVSKGLLEGERVMVQVKKTPEAVALYLAVLQVGGVFVPLNTAYTPNEVSYFINDAGPRVFVCDARNYENTQAVCSDASSEPELLTLGNIDHSQSLESLAENNIPFTEVKDRRNSDLAAFLYTSGTTGRSKGAMLSHSNLISNAQTLHQYWQFEEDDILLHALPIFHIHGLFVALHCALLNASTVLFQSKFDVKQVISSLSEATVMMGVPTFYTRLLAESDFTKHDCTGIRLFISGSAPMTEQVHQEWAERTGHQILERYGMTEAGMITSNPYDGERIPGTVGYPLPGVFARITNNDGKELSSGEIGNIEVKGPNIFQGYWKMPEKTAEEFREDDYFITGDLGVMAEDGRISIVGRGKDLIITGGYNVYPKEIEVMIDDLDEVQESAVIGLTDADFGESVCAVIVLKEKKSLTESQLIDAISANLARFKQPKKTFFVDELPRNTMGKVQKNILRTQFDSVL